MKKIVLFAMDFFTRAAPSTIFTISTSFGGRPKGTATALSTAMPKLAKQCVANSAEEFMSVREEEERKKCKLAGKCTLTCMIERWKESLGIQPISEGEPYILLS